MHNDDFPALPVATPSLSGTAIQVTCAHIHTIYIRKAVEQECTAVLCNVFFVCVSKRRDLGWFSRFVMRTDVWYGCGLEWEDTVKRYVVCYYNKLPRFYAVIFLMFYHMGDIVSSTNGGCLAPCYNKTVPRNIISNDLPPVQYFKHAHFIPIVGVGKRGEY